MKIIDGLSANDAWLNAATGIRGESASVQASRAGGTRELLHVAVRIQDPRNRWVVSRLPPMNPAFSIAEVIWLLAGSNAAAPLNYFNSQLPAFAGHTPTYPGAYGYRLRQHFGLDQIERACAALLTNTQSRQVMLQIWDASTDLPLADGVPRNEDIPCNVASLLKVRDGALHWTQVMRSNDLYRGLPYNIVQFTVLQEIVAGVLGVAVGEYIHWADSLHAYNDALSQFGEDPGVMPLSNSDSLALGWTEFSELVPDLYERLEALSGPALTEAQVISLSTLTEGTAAYQNLMWIVGAASARKRGASDLSKELGDRCSNPVLRQVWRNWHERLQSAREDGFGEVKTL